MKQAIGFLLPVEAVQKLEPLVRKFWAALWLTLLEEL
jgi:hypothetical protein